MSYLGVAGATVPKECAGIRQSALDYIAKIAKENSDHLSSVFFFLQHLCVRIPDRAQYRSAVVNATLFLLTELPSLIPKFTKFIVKLSRNVKANVRVLAVELARVILEHTELIEATAKSNTFALNITEPKDKKRSENEQKLELKVELKEEKKEEKEGKGSRKTGKGSKGSKGSKKGSGRGRGRGRGRGGKGKKKVDEEEEEEKKEKKQDEKASLDEKHKPTESKTQKEGEDKRNFNQIKAYYSEEGAHYTKLLFDVLLSRASDKGATVRAKALTYLAESVQLVGNSPVLQQQLSLLLAEKCLNSTQVADPFQLPAPLGPPLSRQPSAGSSMVTPKRPARNTNTPLMTPSTPLIPLHRHQFRSSILGGGESSVKASVLNTPDVNGSSRLSATPQVEPRSRGVNNIVYILHRRAADPRPVVRKSAVEALEAILVNTTIGNKFLTISDLQIFFDGCMDSSLSIRKRAMNSISSIFRTYPDETVLHKVWMGAVLPLILDQETTVQDKCLEFVQELVLDRLTDAIKAKDFGASIWQMLRVANEEMNGYLQDCIALLLRKKRTPTALINAANKIISTCQEQGLWVILEVISQFVPEKIDHNAVVEAWNIVTAKLGKDKKENKHALRVMRTTGNVASRLPADVLGRLAAFLFGSINEFDKPASPSLIQVQLRTLKQVCVALEATQQHLEKNKQNPIPSWEAELLAICQKELEGFLVRHKGAKIPSEDMLVRYLYTAGEVILISSTSVPSLLATIVQSLLAPTLHVMLPSDKGRDEKKDTPKSQGESKEEPLSESVRAHAFIAFGKIVLKDEKLAKKAMSIFVRELETGTSAVIRNNVLIIMLDLCRSYTAIVDAHTPAITLCLKDSNMLIRRHATAVLSQLLQEDYLRFKGSMFFRLLTCLADDHTTISKFAEQCLNALLTSKLAGRFHPHFIETIFFLNGCKEHPTYNNFEDELKNPIGEERDRLARFYLVGRSEKVVEKRMIVYNYLLKHFNDEHKFTTIAKLCHDVLGAIVEGKLPINEKTSDVISDTLIVLASKQIKLTVKKPEETEEKVMEDDEEKDIGAGASKAKRLAAAHGNFLGKIVRKNTIENIVPILIELKRLLEKKQSPLLKQLMLCLKELLSDYKQELDDVLSGDPQLATEIRYDLRKFEEQQKLEKQRKERELIRISLTPLPPGIVLSPSKRQPSSGITKSTPRRASTGMILATPLRPTHHEKDRGRLSIGGFSPSRQQGEGGSPPRPERKQVGVTPPSAGPIFSSPKLRKNRPSLGGRSSPQPAKILSFAPSTDLIRHSENPETKNRRKSYMIPIDEETGVPIDVKEINVPEIREEDVGDGLLQKMMDEDDEKERKRRISPERRGNSIVLKKKTDVYLPSPDKPTVKLSRWKINPKEIKPKENPTKSDKENEEESDEETKKRQKQEPKSKKSSTKSTISEESESTIPKGKKITKTQTSEKGKGKKTKGGQSKRGRPKRKTKANGKS